MEITHDVLISLGFIKDKRVTNRWTYGGFHGYHLPDAGTFGFHGFTPHLAFVSDLKFIQMLIDHQRQSTGLSSLSNHN